MPSDLGQVRLGSVLYLLFSPTHSLHQIQGLCGIADQNNLIIRVISYMIQHPIEHCMVSWGSYAESGNQVPTPTFQEPQIFLNNCNSIPSPCLFPNHQAVHSRCPVTLRVNPTIQDGYTISEADRSLSKVVNLFLSIIVGHLSRSRRGYII